MREESGFTIIEALVAAVVLTIGLLATFMMLNQSVHASADVRAREGALTLARQITEDARSVPYSQVSSATIVTTLQGYPGLSNSSTGSSWTIVRTGVTYTITANVTTLNDAKDTSGATDIKQVSTTVSWSTYQGKSHSITEIATMSRAGQDPGLSASSLALASPTTGYSGTSTAPVITSKTITSLSFSVTAPTGTTAIVWSLNGAKQTSWAGSTPSSGTTWTSSPWSLSGVSDGTYTIGAQAEDSSGVDGPAVTISVRLIRNVPSAPSVTGYGFNANLMANGTASTAAEFQWKPNSELNVTGYRIYNPSGTLICTTGPTTDSQSCGASAWCFQETVCLDLNPPSVNASNLTYKISPLYFDANNTLQEGTAASVTLASGTPSPPNQPVSLTDTPQLDGSAILTWTPPTSGTLVNFYRIYRDGKNYVDRYDVVSASSCTAVCTYHDTGRSESHSYWVTAVGGTTLGADMGESAPLGPVSG